MTKLSRNEPCPCGSGKKYKKCCLSEINVSNTLDYSWHKMKEATTKTSFLLTQHFDEVYSKDIIMYAWDDFLDYPPDLPDMEDNESVVVQAFLPWFLNNWEPDPTEEDLEGYDEITIAKSYLDKYSDQLNDYEKRFIQANAAAQYSIYEVMHIIPQKSITLRDILRNQTWVVHEKQGTNGLKLHHLLMARILTLDDHSIMVGMHPTVLAASLQNHFIDFKHDIAGERDFTDEMLIEWNPSIRGVYINAVDEMLENSLPQIQNTDGENFVMNDLYFHLYCSPDEAFEALVDMAAGMRKKDLLEDAVYKEGKIIEIDFPWCKLGNKMHKSWQNTILGHIEIRPEKIKVNVNSNERAVQIRNEIESRLKGKISYQVSKIQTSEQMFKNLPEQKTESKDINHLPEVQAVLQKFSKDHWKSWLDTSIPALDGQTPREAAQTKMGKEKLEALLASFHSDNQRVQNSAPVDLHFLRKELKLL